MTRLQEKQKLVSFYPKRSPALPLPAKKESNVIRRSFTEDRRPHATWGQGISKVWQQALAVHSNVHADN